MGWTLVLAYTRGEFQRLSQETANPTNVPRKEDRSRCSLAKFEADEFPGTFSVFSLDSDSGEGAPLQARLVNGDVL
jgi:hypothetical protein